MSRAWTFIVFSLRLLAWLDFGAVLEGIWSRKVCSFSGFWQLIWMWTPWKSDGHQGQFRRFFDKFDITNRFRPFLIIIKSENWFRRTVLTRRIDPWHPGSLTFEKMRLSGFSNFMYLPGGYRPPDPPPWKSELINSVLKLNKVISSFGINFGFGDFFE